MARKIVSPGGGVKDASGAYVNPDIKGSVVNAPVRPLQFNIRSFLFDKQLKFVEDPRPYKIAVCSRRSGKTIACAAHLIDTALRFDKVICLYITLSRNNAKKLIWPELQNINRTYKLNATEDLTELSMTFPNGSTIYCSGAKDQTEIEKFRGLALKLAYVDECQSFREYIEDLINDIISPALLDYAGTLCLIGTPGPIPTGFFHQCAVESEAWSKHGWTFFENPFIKQKSKMEHQELLDRELKRRGVTVDDPSIQREFFGRWILDSESLWIHYDVKLNHFTELNPAIKYDYIMGIDLGFKDADALAVVAWSEKDPNTYLVEESVVSKQGLTELVLDINRLQKKYDISKLVIDEGGLGKKLAEEMRRRHQLPVQAADKARKQENVAFLNDALRTGRFKAKASSNFAKDSQLVEIDRDKSTPDKIKLSNKYHSDIIDAVLYAFKESPAFAYQVAAKAPPKWGTKEWAEQEQRGMFDKAMEHFENQAELEKAFDTGGYYED